MAPDDGMATIPEELNRETKLPGITYCLPQSIGDTIDLTGSRS